MMNVWLSGYRNFRSRARISGYGNNIKLTYGLHFRNDVTALFITAYVSSDTKKS
jgi:hypothetical protein